MPEAYRILGEPRAGGLLIVADHAASAVPADLDLGIDPALLTQHIGVDIGVAGVAAAMVANDASEGTAAFLAGVSRLACDMNRDRDAPGAVPELSDGHAIPGNRLDAAGREARLARVFDPYHAALAALLAAHEPGLILSLHSFTPKLATSDEPRPWQVGVLYNEDERARDALPLLEAEGLVVGDQLPYSGRVLNATMNRHAEAQGRRYLGIEVRQDQIGDAAGQGEWAERLARVCAALMA